MNYRHIYHAGNFADVFKHIVLMRVISYLKQKDKPFFVLDTHAGIGRYDLNSAEARKTMEAEGGIGALYGLDDLPAAVEPLIAPYIALVRKFNENAPILSAYPGSPMIVKDMLRKGDRLVANELHPEDSRTLERILGQDRRIRVERMDGYTALRAFCPPVERRGIVLVDPPFEVTNEFALMVKGLKEAHTRWATGIYALWYPIKSPAAIHLFHQDIKSLNIPSCTAFDFYLRPADDTTLFNGCGMLLVNGPWLLADEMRAVAPLLVETLTHDKGSLRITELSPEKTT